MVQINEVLTLGLLWFILGILFEYQDVFALDVSMNDVYHCEIVSQIQE